MGFGLLYCFGHGIWPLVDPCSEFWLYLYFEGAKNIHVLYVLIWKFGGHWRFLTGVWNLDLDMDMVKNLAWISFEVLIKLR